MIKINKLTQKRRRHTKYDIKVSHINTNFILYLYMLQLIYSKNRMPRGKKREQHLIRCMRKQRAVESQEEAEELEAFEAEQSLRSLYCPHCSR